MGHYRIESDEEKGIDRMFNDEVKCALMLSRAGGELIGYDVFDTEHNMVLPLMWNNNNPTIPTDGSWKNHATILFPIVGGLVNKQSTLGDEIISTKGNHGFCRHSVFNLAATKITDDAAELTYELLPNDEIRGYYPFNFKLNLIYTLRGNVLTLDFKVINTDTRPIWFSCGWHPGFNTEFGLQGKKADWSINFKKGLYTSRKVNADCYLTGEQEEVAYDGALPWTEPQLEGTILLEVPKENRTCTLYNATLQRGVQVDFSDFPHFGLWSEVGKSFFCLEPWQGMDDHAEQESFDKKVGMLTLAAGDEMVKTARITPLLK